MTLRVQIVAGFLLITAAGFYYLTTWVLDEIRPHYLKSMEESLVDQSTILASWVSAEIARGDSATTGLARALELASQRRFEARIYDVIKSRTNVRVYVTDSSGVVIYDSDNGRDVGADYSRWNDVARTLKGAYGARATRAVKDDPQTSSHHVAAPILVSGRVAGVLAIAKPSGSVDEFVSAARGKIIAAATIAAACVIVLGVLLSMLVTRPLQRLTAYARAVRDGAPAHLPRLSGEMAVTAEAIEQMRVALEGKAYVEQYVQTLTHEVKSPLAAIRASAELLQEPLEPERRAQFAAHIEAESLRIQNIVERLLELSAVENRRELRDPAMLDLGQLCRQTAADMAPAFERKGVRLDTTAITDTHVSGELFLLRQAVANLLQNALEFTPPEGTVRIALTCENGIAVVSVEDTGPGMPDYALARAFERFFSLPRPATGRKSSGLGLSLVRQVALLHGGNANLTNRPEGGARATFTVTAA